MSYHHFYSLGATQATTNTPPTVRTMALTIVYTGCLMDGWWGTREELLLGTYTTQTPSRHAHTSYPQAGCSTALHMGHGSQTLYLFLGVFKRVLK